jgi:hypothetical protein
MRHRGRGNAAESAVLDALTQRGFGVLVPFGDGQAYDLLVDLGAATFLRIQCKTAWPEGGCMRFNSRATDHGRGPTSYVGLADVFGVYFPPTRSVYLLPIDVVAGTDARLRLEPPRNNQRRRIRHARDFEIDRWTDDALRALVREDTTMPDSVAAAAR